MTHPELFSGFADAVEEGAGYIQARERSEFQPLHYPNVPGSKGDTGTSEAAAPTESEAATLRRACWVELRFGNFTADEIADRLHRSVLAVRPRISELKRMGKIEPTGERHVNASGKGASVWKLK